MRIGILGGTFDPIHNAHLMIANKAIEEFDLDKVLIMPSPNPPHKSASTITSIEDRIQMIKLAIQDSSKLEFSDFELSREGYVYSADTLKMYKQQNPNDELYFIIGSDSLYSIDTWYHPEIIFENSTILVSRRKDVSLDVFNEKILFLKQNYDISIEEIIVEISDISSTKIRMLSGTDEIHNMVPEKVADYIEKNKLYSVKTQTNMTNAEIIADLKIKLNEHRFQHTINVANTAKKMAEALGENPNKAYLAGLLHDCAKCNSDEENVKLCQNANVEITDIEYKNQYLLHAKAGAVVAHDKYHVNDEDILNSIKYHTTGRPDMSLLEKIIFTADYIEPSRDVQPNLKLLRDIAYKDIDKTMYIILRDTLDYLKNKAKEQKNEDIYQNIDSHMIEAFNYYSKFV